MTTTLSKNKANQANLFAVANAASGPGTSAIKAELAAFLRTLPIGDEFQSIDFTRRLYRNGLVGTGGPDLRCLGGLMIALRGAGVITQVGYRPDGGNPYTNHHSAVRPVYRVISLDKLINLNWETE
jgi:hypothetical protein